MPLPAAIQPILSFTARYERQLSGAGMVGGFAFDNFTFRRIDLPNTQLLFLGYLALAATSIVLLHLFVTREVDGKPMPRWHGMLPMAAQFALGGLWSAFLVFYSRGAVFAEAWPFLLVLAAILIANEVFKKYLTRLVFTAVLFFFALMSYAIVTVPILTRSIGMLTFLLSGAIAILVYLLFLRVVAKVGREQWQTARWQILGGAALVYGLLNLFYFTNILPPLPLALSDEGIYHHVAKTGDVYAAEAEPQLWYTRLWANPEVHLAPGEALYFYSAVFAPIKLSTKVVHRWQHYDERTKRWRTVSRVSYTISGGRDGGYRGYTIKSNPAPGQWRVDVNTPDGHIIGRLRFTVDRVPQAVPLEIKTLGAPA